MKRPRSIVASVIAAGLVMASLALGPSPAGAQVNLEIKNVPTDADYDPTPAYADRVMDVVLSSGIAREQLLIQSFLPAHLDVARRRLPGVATSLLSLGATVDAFLDLAVRSRYDWISPEWPVSRAYVRIHHGSDVVAGMATGAVLGLLARRLLQRADLA